MIRWLAAHLVLNLDAEGVAQPVLDEVECQVRHVNPDPAGRQLLGVAHPIVFSAREGGCRT